MPSGKRRCVALLEEVGLPRDAANRYPHEFSGGQRQRIGIARALALNPRLIVADEPVSALDVSIRSQVLNLMRELQQRHRLTYVVISHDLTVVRYISDLIGVMYLGKLVEVGSSEEVYERSAHPYTAALIATIPLPDPEHERAKTHTSIRGELPSAIEPPPGCRFHTRCPRAQDVCREVEPPLRPFGENHLAACHFPLQEPLDERPPHELAPIRAGAGRAAAYARTADPFGRRQRTTPPSPMFHGCFDWHSAVHGVYSLYALYRRTGCDLYLEAARQHVRPELVDAELDYMRTDEIEQQENPYGFSWVLALVKAQEQATGSSELRPLAELARDRVRALVESLDAESAFELDA